MLSSQWAVLNNSTIQQLNKSTLFSPITPHPLRIRGLNAALDPFRSAFEHQCYDCMILCFTSEKSLVFYGRICTFLSSDHILIFPFRCYRGFVTEGCGAFFQVVDYPHPLLTSNVVSA